MRKEQGTYKVGAFEHALCLCYTSSQYTANIYPLQHKTPAINKVKFKKKKKSKKKKNQKLKK